MPEPPRPPPPVPLAPEDYYLEGGLLVFTSAYHRKRGYCCGSRCRHCPYNHANVVGQKTDQRPAPPPAADDATEDG